MLYFKDTAITKLNLNTIKATEFRLEWANIIYNDAFNLTLFIFINFSFPIDFLFLLTLPSYNFP